MAAKYLKHTSDLIYDLQNTNKLQKSQTFTILYNFIVAASSFTHPYMKNYFFFFFNDKSTTETGILKIIL